MKKSAALVAGILVIVGIILWKSNPDLDVLVENPPPEIPKPVPVVTPQVAQPKPEVTPPPKKAPKAAKATARKKKIPPPVKKAPPKKAPAVKPPPEMAPPPIKIHKELIPKNIEIIRVYYSSEFTGPSTTIGFDINGAGFTQEFEKMITVESGHEGVEVKNLKLRTPNQIHGELKVGKKVPTTVIFPRVLIQGKVVFRAAQPFAVIRPGEVLNLVFTRMGESGRSGQFRVFTNLTEKMYKKFSIQSTTDTIQVNNVSPRLPYVVDADINIGAAPAGFYGLSVLLGKKTIWEKKNLVRIIQPNVGETGLVQRLNPVDGFHRPGDEAKFVLQGSGFRPQDISLLHVQVPGWEKVVSTLTFVAPGRIDLTLRVAESAKVNPYAIEVFQGEKSLLNRKNAFVVVAPNWTRGVKVQPALVPGGDSTLILEGRDMDEGFIKSIKIEVDDPNLSIDPFTSAGPDKAQAKIKAGPNVLPGDYWLKMSNEKGPILPQFGSIIRISKK